MAQITYTNKVALNENQEVADINKVNASDMNEIKNVINTNTPVGSISMYAGSTAPNGWLICDGSAVSRTDYADLFSVIGTTYGSGDGSTTFNLPNLKGRVAVGLDGDDTDFDSLGATGGEKEHTLTVDEIPSHHHTLSPTGRLGNFTNGSGYTTIVNNTYGSVGNINSSNVGGSAAHNIMQPYIVLNYIISY